MDSVQFPAQSKRAIIAPYPKKPRIQAAWVRGLDAAKRKREESSSAETWLPIVWWKETHARDELVGWKTWRRDGIPKIFFLSDHGYSHSQGKGFHKGSLSLGAMLEISIPNIPSSWSSFCTAVLWLGTFGRDGIFLPEELTISCWISCKEIWKIRFWSTCCWIIIICRIRAVAAFSFTQFLEAGVKIEITSQFKTVLVECYNLELSKLIRF